MEVRGLKRLHAPPQEGKAEKSLVRGGERAGGGRKLLVTLQHPPCAAPEGYLILPGSWAQDRLVISLPVVAMSCQRGGRAVTPSGPTMQQQMGPQHHGIDVDVCWGVGDGHGLEQ